MKFVLVPMDFTTVIGEDYVQVGSPVSRHREMFIWHFNKWSQRKCISRDVEDVEAFQSKADTTSESLMGCIHFATVVISMKCKMTRRMDRTILVLIVVNPQESELLISTQWIESEVCRSKRWSTYVIRHIPIQSVLVDSWPVPVSWVFTYSDWSLAQVYTTGILLPFCLQYNSSEPERAPKIF